MAKRRGRGEGSIFQRAKDGLYVGSLHVGYDAAGKRIRQVVYGATKREVLERLADRRASVALGVVEPSKATTAEYLRAWLEHTARPQIRVNSYRCYRNVIETHVVPQLGGVPLKALTSGHFEALLGGMERAGKSPRLRQLALVTMKLAFKSAVATHKIPRSPVSGLKSPQVVGKRWVPWDAEQVRTFLEASQSERLHGLFVTALHSGMRFGELLGLQWSEVDLKTGVISVSATLIEQGGKVLGRNEVKTAAGRRTVTLPPSAVGALRAHRARLLAEGLSGSEWVFPSEAGTPMHQRNVTKAFQRVMVAAGVPRIRFHDLRHTSATLMITNGVDVKTVSERLGHANAQITLQTYTHRTQASDSAAAGMLESLLAPRKENTRE